MLVNLTPKNKFRTISERHCKYMNSIREQDEPKHYPLRFNDLFKPTEYTGVYMTSASEYAIEAWCKQRAFCNTKKFRNIIDNIPKEDVTSFVHTNLNAWTYGVADNLEQIVQFYKDNKDDYFCGNHVIFVTETLEASKDGFDATKQVINMQEPKLLKLAHIFFMFCYLMLRNPGPEWADQIVSVQN